MAQITKPLTLTPKRGELYLVKFDPSVGAEIKKTRPALIIQNDLGNLYGPTTIVAAVTSRSNGAQYPFEISLSKDEGGLSTDSVILLNQIRTADKIRLVKKLGEVRGDILEKVDDALKISLGIA